MSRRVLHRYSQLTKSGTLGVSSMLSLLRRTHVSLDTLPVWDVQGLQCWKSVVSPGRIVKPQKFRHASASSCDSSHGAVNLDRRLHCKAGWSGRSRGGEDIRSPRKEGWSTTRCREAGVIEGPKQWSATSAM